MDYASEMLAARELEQTSKLVPQNAARSPRRYRVMAKKSPPIEATPIEPRRSADEWVRHEWLASPDHPRGPIEFI